MYFCFQIAGCEQNFDLGTREKDCIEEIKAKVGTTNKVLVRDFC